MVSPPIGVIVGELDMRVQGLLLHKFSSPPAHVLRLVVGIWKKAADLDLAMSARRALVLSDGAGEALQTSGLRPGAWRKDQRSATAV